MSSDPAVRPRTLAGRSSRFAAMQMDIGNLVSMCLPPLPLLWFGGSMLVYALHRHHPDARVGQYTQAAAYRFYAVMGAIIPIGTFFPGRGIASWLIAWGIGLAVIVPWSIWAIVRIRREDWPDLVLDADPGVEETPHA